MSHNVFLTVRRESFILFIMSRFAHVNQRQHAVVFTTTLKQNACIPFISATLVAFNRRSALTQSHAIRHFDHRQLAFLDTRLLEVPRKSAFFSSDESEEEEDHRKKFKIKIKPLPADQVVTVPSVDELKASIGNIALSPSPLVSHAAVTALLDSSGRAGVLFCMVSLLLFLT